jgi:hypothetical protein
MPMTETREPSRAGVALSSGARIDLELRDADDAERRLPGGLIDDTGVVPLPGVGDELAITRSDARRAPATACYTVVRRRIGYDLEGEAQGVPLRAWVVLWVRPGAEPA